RIHPETGRRALYFDPGKICYFVGIDDAEGDALIAELKDRMIVPDGEYHHVWRKGDVVIWDNRCSYHKAAGDYPPEEDRIHWRVSINDYGVEAREAAEEATPTTASISRGAARRRPDPRAPTRSAGTPPVRRRRSDESAPHCAPRSER